jgi:hypothetical protein
MKQNDFVKLTSASYSLAITWEDSDYDNADLSRIYYDDSPFKEKNPVPEEDWAFAPNTKFVVMATDCVLPTHMVEKKAGGVKSVQQNTVIIKNTENGDIIFTQERFLAPWKEDICVGSVVTFKCSGYATSASCGDSRDVYVSDHDAFIVIALGCSGLPGRDNDCILKNVNTGVVVFYTEDGIEVV